MTSSPAPSPPLVARYLLPSVRDLIFLVTFWAVLAGPLSTRPLADADIGWHIRTGEQILATRAFPRTDPYSSTMQGQPWFAWEWLYDALLGWMHQAMGLNGVIFLAALLVATTFAALFWELLRRGTGMPVALPLWLLALGGASIHLFARPHIVSWLLTLLWFVALERWQRGNAPAWLRWFFPLSMVLWVNLHGGWIFGLTLSAVYMVASFVESLREKDDLTRILGRKRAAAMLWTFALSALATLVNPYGWRLHEHIYRYLSDPYLMNRIAEFRSPDFHGFGQRCYVLILMLVLTAFAVGRGKIRLSDWLVVPLVAYSGVYAARGLPVASMILVLIAGPKLWWGVLDLAARPAAWRKLRGWAAWAANFDDRARAQELGQRGRVWAALGVMAALAICLAGGRVGSTKIVQAEFDARHLPVGAVKYLQQEASVEPVFCPDHWGGYLIYRLYPQRHVVIDDRHDLYGAERFREYDVLMQGAPGWRDVLERWQLRTLVLPSDSTLANLLRLIPQEWQVSHEGPVAVVMEKKPKP
jgi:hypothetical protein